MKGESVSTDAVKECNKCKKDIALLIAVTFSDYFEQIQRLLSKETVVHRRWGSETLKFGIKQLHMDQLSTKNRYQSRHFER